MIKKIFKDFNMQEKILVITSIIVFVIAVIFIFSFGNTWIHSDSAASVIWAKEQAKSGKLLPDGWYDSTFIMLISMVMAIFAKFISDYLLVRNVGQFVFVVILLIAIIVFSRKVLKNNSWLLIVPILFGFWSRTQYEVMYIQAVYTSFLFFILFALSLFYMAVDIKNNFKISKKKLVLFLMVLFIAFIDGIMTVQQIVIPLIGSILLLYINKNNGKKFSIEDDIINNNVVPISFFICVVTLIGGISILLLEHLFNTYGNMQITVTASSYDKFVENLRFIFQGTISVMGVASNVKLFSIAGLQNIVKIVSFTFLWFVIPIKRFKNIRNTSDERKVFLVFSIINVIEVLIILLFGSVPSDYSAFARYLLIPLMLLTLISCDYLYEEHIKKYNIKGWFYTLSVVSFCGLISLSIFSLNFVKYREKMADFKALTDFLIDNNLYYGYASFWNAGNNMTLSNGKVQIGGIKLNGNNVQKFPWLSFEKFYDENNYTGDTFLLLNSSEYDEFASSGVNNTRFGTPKMVLNYTSKHLLLPNDVAFLWGLPVLDTTYTQYYILVYDYNIAKNNFGILQNNMLQTMQTNGRLEGNKVYLSKGQILYGPYIDLEKGHYEITVNLECQSSETLKITSSSGQKIIGEFPLFSGINKFEIALKDGENYVEFVIGCLEEEIQISEISILKK